MRRPLGGPWARNVPLAFETFAKGTLHAVFRASGTKEREYPYVFSHDATTSVGGYA